ncbi:fungal-specific transcription factor domain-containing protein [Trichoderma velutinum]
MSEQAADASNWERSDARARPAPTVNTIRRIRQACTNCRCANSPLRVLQPPAQVGNAVSAAERSWLASPAWGAWKLHRKTRCSGERPRCMNCRRVDRVCHYEPYSATNPPNASSSNGSVKGRSPSAPTTTSTLFPRTGVVDPELLNRINTIESQLAQLHSQGLIGFLNGENRNGQVTFPDLAASTTYQDLSPEFTEPSPPQQQFPPSVPETTEPVSDIANAMRFTTAPPPPVMAHLIDTYFLHVHNQPYTYFHEQSFRERLNYGLVPKCLLFGILASALKFSDSDYFAGCRREATEAYAREAWLALLNDHLTVENNPTLQVAQASNILGVVDFTCGRTSSGWLKIGLAVRIAQDLQLMKEPKSTLSPIEQEEHRRAFWSIYLLDKLVSVGQSRPPAISEEDIHVQLPVDEETFRRGVWKKTPTLHQLINWKSEGESAVNGTFTQTILAATALGRCVRYVLHGREIDEMPPWDPRSDFTLLNTFLLLIDHHLQVETIPIPQIVEQYRKPDGTLDFQSLEHVVFARITFHTAHCLLNHPFLLRMRLQKGNCKVPPKFLTRSFEVSCDHARAISSVVEDAITSGCHVQSSFYAYASILAGGILSLAIHIDQEKGQVTDPELLSHYQKAIHILERVGRRWDHASKMHLQLMLFDANYHSLSALLDSTSPEVDPKLESALWLMVDYVAMSALNENALTPPPLSTDTFLSPLDSQMNMENNDGFTGMAPDANSDPNVAFLGNGSVPL